MGQQHINKHNVSFDSLPANSMKSLNKDYLTLSAFVNFEFLSELTRSVTSTDKEIWIWLLLFTASKGYLLAVCVCVYIGK